MTTPIINLPQPQVMTTGWIARDEDGDIHLHSRLPERAYDDDLNHGYWANFADGKMLISRGLFPALTWLDQPLEVTITLKPRK